jgi:hypothetical protein
MGAHSTADVRTARWPSDLIIVCAGLFVFALVLSAVFDPRIRGLHVFQALPYLAAMVFAFKKNPWMLGGGTGIALIWNYIWLHQLLHATSLADPSLVVMTLPATAHVELIVGSLVAFLRLKPAHRQWIQFIAGGLISAAYLVIIVILTGPQYTVDLLRQVFGV